MASDVPKPKRFKSLGILPEAKWRLFDSQISRRLLQAGSRAFFRPKSATEFGRQGQLLAYKKDENKWKIQFDGDSREQTKSAKRLLPVFVSTSSPDNNNNNKPLILITFETIHYRHLAASQLTGTDSVLELGCSTGETSKVIWKYAASWMGFDTGQQMVQSTRALADSKLGTGGQTNSNISCQTRCEQMDVLQDATRAMELVKSHQRGTTNVVFVDIGGNREEAGVLHMLEWVLDYFPVVRLVVVKSKEVFGALKDKAMPCGLVVDGNAWFQERLQAVRTIPSHPLQAAKVFSPTDPSQPICRYHNYHVDGCKKGKECPFDHIYCHMCLSRGHRAIHCPTVKTS